MISDATIVIQVTAASPTAYDCGMVGNIRVKIKESGGRDCKSSARLTATEV